MSGPHGGAEPPAILIAWSSADNAWRATAVLLAGAEPIDVVGPSSSLGTNPAAALDQLLGRRFGILACQDCAPTIVAIGDAAIDAGEEHCCPACPVETRDLGAVLHNLVGQLERGTSVLDERAQRKLASAKEALARWQPIVDGHFAITRPALVTIECAEEAR